MKHRRYSGIRDIGLVLLAALIVAGGALGCSSGSSAQIKAKDLTAAEVTNLYPSDSDEPSTFALDLSDEWTRDRLLSSYESMAPWTGDEASIPLPDVQLTMYFKGDRKTVLSLAREDHTIILLEQYKGGKLEDSFYMRPMLMYEFMNDLVIEPGGW
jgi:hypothetical protein